MSITKVLEFKNGEQVLISGDSETIALIAGLMKAYADGSGTIRNLEEVIATRAPKAARVAMGLELLETAEKLGAIRATGYTIDITDLGEYPPPAEKRFSIDIAEYQEVKPNEYLSIVFVNVDGDTQHAATLAAIAAYEAEFGEIKA